MLNRRAIEAFLDKPRVDHRYVKELSAAQVDALVHDLPIVPPIWEQLDKVQKTCLYLGATQKRFAFFNDTGTGKTLLGLALAAYAHYLSGDPRPFLILVPRRANKWSWVRELKKQVPWMTYTVLQGTSEEKWVQAFETKAMIVLETYSGFVKIMCPLKKVKRKKQGEEVDLNKLVPDPRLMKHLQKLFQGVILDESHRCKNHKSLPYRLCRKLAQIMEWFFIGSATPFGKDPVDLWAQMYLVDFGDTLGPTVGLFRAALFDSKPGYFGGTKHTFPKKNEALLNRLLAHRSIEYKVDEADLPPCVPILRQVSAPKAYQAFIDAARTTLTSARGNYQETKNAFLRMRQLSSGFVGFTDDDTGDKVKVAFPYNPKLEEMLTDVEAVCEKGTDKVIIFYEYNASGDRICAELAKLKIGHLRLYGGTKGSDVAKMEQRFSEVDKYKVLVMNNAMSDGLNLQVARYGMVYESPTSPITRKQIVRRFVRQHSKYKTVFLYDYVMRGTYDQQILDSLKAGEDLFESIMRGKKRQKVAA